MLSNFCAQIVLRFFVLKFVLLKGVSRGVYKSKGMAYNYNK